jgi:glycosyltransferase A (GT-A) superfamily protein (DUF2064 family)
MKSMNCIIVFTKAPIPNQVKTRLVRGGVLDTNQATMIYEAFLSDVLETVGRYISSRSSDLIISYTPQEGLDGIAETVKNLRSQLIVTDFHLQKGETFDDRINDAFSSAFELGYEAVVMIGGDSPTLREEHLDEAFRLLCTTRKSDKEIAVVGPGIDGGIYLIGLRKGVAFNFKGIFQKRDERDVSLSTLENKARELHTQLFKTSIHYDIDAPKDLETLREELFQNSALAPHTRGVLEKLKKL